MAVSPDDRFAGLLNSSAERGGWVPGDVFTADSAGEAEVVEPRRVRLPVLVAVAIATVGVLVLAFFLFRPADQHSPAGAGGSGDQAGEPDRTSGSSEQAGASTGGGSAPAGSAAGTGAGAGGSASAAPSGDVIVHVTGAVREPSVVTLKAGARVRDAVEAAGGLSAGADAESINLARVLADGEQIHIPQEGEAPAGGSAAGQGAGGGTAGGADAASNAAADGDGTADGGGTAGGESSDAAGGAPGAAEKIDLNTADAAALETLPGVGPVTAEAIIAHRQTQPFASVDDLLLVKGIGPKTFESLKDRVTVG